MPLPDFENVAGRAAAAVADHTKHSARAEFTAERGWHVVAEDAGGLQSVEVSATPGSGQKINVPVYAADSLA